MHHQRVALLMQLVNMNRQELAYKFKSKQDLIQYLNQHRKCRIHFF